MLKPYDEGDSPSYGAEIMGGGGGEGDNQYYTDGRFNLRRVIRLPETRYRNSCMCLFSRRFAILCRAFYHNLQKSVSVFAADDHSTGRINLITLPNIIIFALSKITTIQISTFL